MEEVLELGYDSVYYSESTGGFHVILKMRGGKVIECRILLQ